MHPAQLKACRLRSRSWQRTLWTCAALQWCARTGRDCDWDGLPVLWTPGVRWPVLACRAGAPGEPRALPLCCAAGAAPRSAAMLFLARW